LNKKVELLIFTQITLVLSSFSFRREALNGKWEIVIVAKNDALLLVLSMVCSFVRSKRSKESKGSFY